MQRNMSISDLGALHQARGGERSIARSTGPCPGRPWSASESGETPSTCRSGRSQVGTSRRRHSARWLIKDSEVLILDEPTRGVDIGAKREIYLNSLMSWPGSRQGRPRHLFRPARSHRHQRPHSRGPQRTDRCGTGLRRGGRGTGHGIRVRDPRNSRKKSDSL